MLSEVHRGEQQQPQYRSFVEGAQHVRVSAQLAFNDVAASATFDLGRSMRLGIITAGCAALLFGAPANAADVTSRILEGAVYYRLSLPPCEVPAAVLRIARAAEIPTGIEGLPDDCRWQPTAPPPEGDKVHLTGKRLGEALNELVAADPRYAWIESKGVIVIRPVEAWKNPEHFLHRTIRPFTVAQQHAGVAFQEWRQAVWEENRSLGAIPSLPSEEGSRPFTVTIARESSAISALEQIVRAHGRLVWQVHYYRGPAAECRFATLVYLAAEDPVNSPRGVQWDSRAYLGMAKPFGPVIDECKGN